MLCASSKVHACAETNDSFEVAEQNIVASFACFCMLFHVCCSMYAVPCMLFKPRC